MLNYYLRYKYLGVGLKGFTAYFIEMVTEYSW